SSGNGSTSGGPRTTPCDATSMRSAARNHRATSNASGHRSSLMHHEGEPAIRIGMTPDDWLPASMRPARRGKQGVPDPAREIRGRRPCDTPRDLLIQPGAAGAGVGEESIGGACETVDGTG